MTGTISEDTEFSATAATPNQTLTMVAGRASSSGQIFTGYGSGMGSLSPDKIYYNGKEYTISDLCDMRQGIIASLGTLGFSEIPPFKKITFDIDGVGATYNMNSRVLTTFFGPIVGFADGTTYTIKVVSIE